MKYAVLFEPPVKLGNKFERNPKAAEILSQILGGAKPEAGYFGIDRRWVLMIVNVESQDDLIKLLLPIWHMFEVYPQVIPVNSMEGFEAQFSKMQEAVKEIPEL